MSWIEKLRIHKVWWKNSKIWKFQSMCINNNNIKKFDKKLKPNGIEPFSLDSCVRFHMKTLEWKAKYCICHSFGIDYRFAFSSLPFFCFLQHNNENNKRYQLIVDLDSTGMIFIEQRENPTNMVPIRHIREMRCEYFQCGTCSRFAYESQTHTHIHKHIVYFGLNTMIKVSHSIYRESILHLSHCSRAW